MTRPFPAGAAPGVGPTPINQSLGQRIGGIVRRPRSTFAQVIAAPSWAAVMVLTTVVSAAAGAGLMATEVGRQALLDQWERTATAFGQDVDDAGYARLRELSQDAGVEYAVASAVLSGPVLTVGIAALLMLVYRKARFTQALAVAAHAAVILAARQVIAAALGYLRESTSSATALGAWFPGLDEASPVARFLGAIDLFVIWWLVVLAIGAAVLFQRPVRSTVATFVGIYAALALLLAAAMALSGGAV